MSKQYSKVQQTLISIFVYFLFIHTTNFSPNQGHIFFKWVVLNILFVWHIRTTILVLSFILLLFCIWLGRNGRSKNSSLSLLPATTKICFIFFLQERLKTSTHKSFTYNIGWIFYNHLLMPVAFISVLRFTFFWRLELVLPLFLILLYPSWDKKISSVPVLLCLSFLVQKLVDLR